jgi:hypothetical protein
VDHEVAAIAGVRVRGLRVAYDAETIQQKRCFCHPPAFCSALFRGLRPVFETRLRQTVLGVEYC